MAGYYIRYLVERIKRWGAVITFSLTLVLLALAVSCGSQPANASTANDDRIVVTGHVPVNAKRYQRLLTRSAHAHWGLDAPIATFAAQVHQESAWQADALSPAGARGLAQFMPATSDWFSTLYPDLADNQPLNAGWALRALVLYDRWLYQRMTAADDCERWAMTLSSYNGGQGWLQRDIALASALGGDPLAWFDNVELHTSRAEWARRENRAYVRQILLRWQVIYVTAGWGDGVCQ